MVTLRPLGERGLLQLSLSDTFFTLKELMCQRGRYGTYLADVPTSIKQGGSPELVCNWLCVESLPPPHSVSIARHLISLTNARVSDTCL